MRVLLTLMNTSRALRKILHRVLSQISLKIVMASNYFYLVKRILYNLKTLAKIYLTSLFPQLAQTQRLKEMGSVTSLFRYLVDKCQVKSHAI